MSPASYETGFLRDDEGRLSMMRLLSYKTWFIFAFMVVWQTVKDSYNIWAILIVGSLAFMPKVFQKIVEAYLKIKIEKDNG